MLEPPSHPVAASLRRVDGPLCTGFKQGAMSGKSGCYIRRLLAQEALEYKMRKVSSKAEGPMLFSESGLQVTLFGYLPNREPQKTDFGCPIGVPSNQPAKGAPSNDKHRFHSSTH